MWAQRGLPLPSSACVPAEEESLVRAGEDTLGVLLFIRTRYSQKPTKPEPQVRADP